MPLKWSCYKDERAEEYNLVAIWSGLSQSVMTKEPRKPLLQPGGPSGRVPQVGNCLNDHCNHKSTKNVELASA